MKQLKSIRLAPRLYRVEYQGLILDIAGVTEEGETFWDLFVNSNDYFTWVDTYATKREALADIVRIEWEQ